MKRQCLSTTTAAAAATTTTTSESMNFEASNVSDTTTKYRFPLLFTGKHLSIPYMFLLSKGNNNNNNNNNRSNTTHSHTLTQ